MNAALALQSAVPPFTRLYIISRGGGHVSYYRHTPEDEQPFTNVTRLLLAYRGLPPASSTDAPIDATVWVGLIARDLYGSSGRINAEYIP